VVPENKRGRPATGKGTQVQVRLQPDLLRALDRFIAEEAPDVSRPEALRTAFKDWAVAHGYLHSGDEGIRPEDLNASNDD
jgi:metal-responsive CopG/Arc/MetJ family transcriptional regulator